MRGLGDDSPDAVGASTLLQLDGHHGAAVTVGLVDTAELVEGLAVV